MISLYTIAAALLAFTVISIYARLHDALSPIPGPKLWAISRVPWLWHTYRGTLVQRSRELHTKYGDVVRIAPAEVSYSSNQAWRDIHTRQPGAKYAFPRDQDWLKPEAGRVNPIIQANAEDHSRMRPILAKAFDPPTVAKQEPVIKKHTSRLVSRVAQAASEAGGTIDIGEWLAFWAYDVIGELTFGNETIDCLPRGALHPAIQNLAELTNNMSYMTMIKRLPIPHAEDLLKFLLPDQYKKWKRNRINGTLSGFVSRALTERASLTSEAEEKRNDVTHALLKGVEAGEITPQEMGANAALMLGGGGDTMTMALGAMVNLLCRYPGAMQKATTEVRDRFSNLDEITSATVQPLAFLNRAMRECLRLASPVGVALPREVPAGGARVGDYWLPEGTAVGVHLWSTFTAEEKWHDPLGFHPERWDRSATDDPASPFHADQREVHHPFSMGPMRCAGEPLAWAELRICMASVLFAFDLEASAGPKGEPFVKWEEQKNMPTWVREPWFVKVTPFNVKA